MKFATIVVEDHNECMTITLNRIDQQNAINSILLSELNQALDEAEGKSQCRFVILKGHRGIFCSGMDLQEYMQLAKGSETMHAWAAHYMKTLKRLTTTSKIIVAVIDGKVTAGGIGFVAASDFAIATENASFKLSEALWGLIPAMVAPYLIRRVGFQQGYSLALTTRTISAEDALDINLIDTLCNDLEEALLLLSQRMERVKGTTIKKLKTYFGKLIITEAMETMAIEETVRRMLDPEVQENIRNFIEYKTLPWHK